MCAWMRRTHHIIALGDFLELSPRDFAPSLCVREAHQQELPKSGGNRCELSREKSKRAPRPRLRCICRPLSELSAFQSNAADWVCDAKLDASHLSKMNTAGWEIAT
jgi:hypothetical protein